MRIAAIVLAAGRSARMAARHKLLQPLDGKPIVCHVAGTALASGADPVIVVTGSEAPRIAEALGDLSVTIANNAAFEQGLSTSLRAGLAALPPGIDGAIMLLGDMPRVGISVLRALMAAFGSAGDICVPVNEGRTGNPILWGRRYFHEMMRITGDFGAKPLLARHKARMIEVEVGSSGIFADVDTAEDLARLKGGAE
ncbi:MAG: nucleotidyltransferase family protein [Methyloceanibacter sp.]